jgi:hypothetical protein
MQMASVANELAAARCKLGEAEHANAALKEKRQLHEQQIDVLEASVRTLREEGGACRRGKVVAGARGGGGMSPAIP